MKLLLCGFEDCMLEPDLIRNYFELISSEFSSWNVIYFLKESYVKSISKLGANLDISTKYQLIILFHVIYKIIMVMKIDSNV